MEPKKETETKLKRYLRQKKSIENLRREILMLRESMHHPPSSDEARALGDLIRRHERANQEVQAVEEALSYLREEDIRFVKAYYFVPRRLPMWKLERELGMSERTIYRFRNQVLTTLCTLFYGEEE